ncbi:MAG: tryptophan-rich sensory protein [Gammaproteobacteria bacterium]|nr:tryptophan-rich sensory protein [Gammaproteobacteria bacterium]MDE2348577.1 tryptophan-rich sensory protein [Gammaproteobacteria bacterium]
MIVAPRWKPVVAAALAASAVAALGALTTDIGDWYFALRKPAWQPPDWAFGPAWTLIFALTALAAVVYWRREPSRDERLRTLAAFAINAFLNTFWSLLFFRLHRPDWALFEVGFLWLSILALLVRLRRGSVTAAWLVAPYLAWVSFASVLNWTIVKLNGPFGG